MDGRYQIEEERRSQDGGFLWRQMHLLYLRMRWWRWQLWLFE